MSRGYLLTLKSINFVVNTSKNMGFWPRLFHRASFVQPHESGQDGMRPYRPPQNGAGRKLDRSGLASHSIAHNTNLLVVVFCVLLLRYN